MKRVVYAISVAFFLLVWTPTHAVDITHAIQETYKKTETIIAEFTQNTYVEILEREQSRSGKLYFGHNQFRIEYDKPHQQLYVFNGDTLWIYSPKFKEVEVYEDAGLRISKEALSFLSGLGDLRSTFRIPEIKKLNGITTLTLIPRDKKSRLKKIQLIVDNSSYSLQEATLWPKRGNRSRYIFSKLKLDKKISDKKFNFKIPKNVSIVRPDA